LSCFKIAKVNIFIHLRIRALRYVNKTGFCSSNIFKE
jgi:hypothetical protein